MAREGVKWPALPLSVYLLLAILLVTAPVVCLISVVDYVGTARELEENADEFQDQTETGIVLSMTLVDTGLNLFDNTLDRRMEGGSARSLRSMSGPEEIPGRWTSPGSGRNSAGRWRSMSSTRAASSSTPPTNPISGSISGLSPISTTG